MSLMSPIEHRAALAIAEKVPRENVVVFDVLESHLHGRIGRQPFGPWAVWSGAGQNPGKSVAVTLGKWLPSQKKSGSADGERGGIIPPGWWIILPEDLKQGHRSRYLPGQKSGGAPTEHSLKLVPYSLDAGWDSQTAQARDGFYIHGASRTPAKVGSGSDGCILMDRGPRAWLASAVAATGGAWLAVRVDRAKFDRIIEWNRKHAFTA